jgi:hypothetical protein
LVNKLYLFDLKMNRDFELWKEYYNVHLKEMYNLVRKSESSSSEGTGLTCSFDEFVEFIYIQTSQRGSIERFSVSSF